MTPDIRASNDDSTPSSPTSIRIARLADVLTVAGLADFSGAVLLAYLERQRWYGAKGSSPSSARVIDVVPLPWNDTISGIAIVELTTANATTRYQMPMSVLRSGPGTSAPLAASVVIAKIVAEDGNAMLIDAMHDPAFQRNLGAAFMAPTSFFSPLDSRWTFETASKVPPVFPKGTDVTLGSAEQSNTGLVYGRQAIFKLFRKIEAGVHPDVELTRFLTIDAAFPHVPTLFGTITYHDEMGGAVAGMMQEYLAGSMDAWTYILQTARASASPTLATRDVERLGRITREMHDALSGDAASAAGSPFVPVSAGAGDVERWAQRTKETIREATTLLERQRSAGKLSRERAAEADVLIRRRDHYLAWVEEIADVIGEDGGARIRVHGDYHLGQVLRTQSDSFVIIDFEGEPARPLAERREKTSALRDVAGMLRSLAYAAATIMRTEADPVHRDARTAAERELAGGRWERDARAAFLRGYTGAMQDEQGFLPRDPKHFDALLSLFEAEKAFYEMSYELNHRPGWEWIPMRGISRLLAK